LNFIEKNKSDLIFNLKVTINSFLFPHEDFLWATLAGLAVADKNYPVAEVCYGQLHEAEKVLFLSELRGLQQQHQKQSQNPQLTTMSAAQIAQFGGHCREAESALIQSGQYFKAIQLNLGVFRFDR
jgi:intraflagellar transport protein 80